jgi:hypothetical protein
MPRPAANPSANLQARVCTNSSPTWRRLGHRQAVLVTHAGVIKVLAGLERNLPATEWMALASTMKAWFGSSIRRIWRIGRQGCMLAVHSTLDQSPEAP